jgi:TRAP-type C4-dicarboxylate transport system permease small subunit
MRHIEKVVHWMTEKSVILCGVFIMAWVLLITINVILRQFDSVIYGNYELVEVFALALVGFMLAFAGLKHSHISVKMLIERLPKQWQKRTTVFALVVELVFWGLIWWTSTDLLADNGFSEKTLQLDVPVFPFRLLWVLGLLLFFLVLLVEFVNSIKGPNK